MKRVLLTLLFFALLLAGCRRGAEPAPNDADFDVVPPSPTLEEVDAGGGFDIPLLGSAPSPTPEGGTVVIPTSEAFEGRLLNLRFASSSEGSEQSTFPVGTEEIYAIWDYDGMSPDDSIERVWYHNDEIYVERQEEWDFLKYGFAGTVRDIYLYDYIDGIDPGQWRVEVYLNNELHLTGDFSIGQ